MDQVITPAREAHSGRLVKTLGDGVLAEFSSVVDAVTCARAIPEKMPLLEATAPNGQALVFRIGINLGDLIIEGDDIHGPGGHSGTLSPAAAISWPPRRSYQALAHINAVEPVPFMGPAAVYGHGAIFNWRLR